MARAPPRPAGERALGSAGAADPILSPVWGPGVAGPLLTPEPPSLAWLQSGAWEGGGGGGTGAGGEGRHVTIYPRQIKKLI